MDKINVPLLENILWRERFVRDAVCHERTDSIPVIVEKRGSVFLLDCFQTVNSFFLEIGSDFFAIGLFIREMRNISRSYFA